MSNTVQRRTGAPSRLPSGSSTSSTKLFVPCGGLLHARSGEVLPPSPDDASGTTPLSNALDDKDRVPRLAASGRSKTIGDGGVNGVAVAPGVGDGALCAAAASGAASNKAASNERTLNARRQDMR